MSCGARRSLAPCHATVEGSAQTAMPRRASPLARAGQSHYPPRDERELVARTRAGDYDAFDTIFSLYADRLSAYAYGFLRSSDDAREAVQDVFLAIWQNRLRWQVPGELRTYLYRSVRNRCISAMRRRRVERFFRLRTEQHYHRDPVAPAAGGDAQVRLETAELAARVQKVVDGLPERCRQVFILNRQHEMSYAEVAEVLQIAVKTVENHMARAFAALRQALSEYR